MTDEEKAKAYICRISKKHSLSNAELECAKQGYIDGLKEGRKDIAQKEIVTVKNTYNELFDFCKELELKNKTLNLYISRGGFIKDRNGRWCKDGDKVLVENANEGVDESLPCKLCWDKDEYVFRLEQNGILFGIEDTFVKLVEPC